MKILETERLNLRQIEASDDEFILDLLNQPSFIKNIGDRNVRTLQQAREAIENRYRQSYTENGFGLYAVELKAAAEDQKPKTESQRPIGICGFVRREGLADVDIGFAFLPQFERKGYAFESASAMMEYGREVLNLRRIVAIVAPHNESSIRLLGNLGFEFEGLITLPNDTEEIKLFASDTEQISATDEHR